MRESKDYLCYCGLYCKMCSIINGLPQAARSLHQIMQEDGWEGFGSFMYPEFGDFWKVLAELKEMDNTSPHPIASDCARTPKAGNDMRSGSGGDF